MVRPPTPARPERPTPRARPPRPCPARGLRPARRTRPAVAPAPVPRPRPARPVPALHACGLCRPRDGVIEAFARITTGARLRALAFRLERGGDARWRCAALDLGPVP
ncbi:Rv3235 family protein [Streptomyces albulus]|nr:Rv3235 family protein [Streptomyces noursei]